MPCPNANLLAVLTPARTLTFTSPCTLSLPTPLSKALAIYHDVDAEDLANLPSDQWEASMLTLVETEPRKTVVLEGRSVNRTKTDARGSADHGDGSSRQQPDRYILAPADTLTLTLTLTQLHAVPSTLLN